MNLIRTSRNLLPARRKYRSGNLSGSPQTLPFSNALREMLEQPVPSGMRKILNRELRIDLRPGACFVDAMVLAIFAKAVTGDVSAIKEITDRVEGRAGKRDEFSAQPEVKIRVVYDSPIAEAGWPSEPSSPTSATQKDKTDAQGNLGRHAEVDQARDDQRP
jgi:hypothetical protein